MEIKKVGCSICPWHCGLLVQIENGQVVEIKGNPSHPISRGFICLKAAHAIKWLYHPDQLKYPLKRSGERGEGKWERITWDRAMDEIAQKLRSIKENFGPEALAFCEGNNRMETYWARARFANLLGNPQNAISPGTICFSNCYNINLAIAGWPIFRADAEETSCLILWGQNPAESNPLLWRTIKQRKKGDPPLKLIVIDPRITEIADYADMCLQLRPGTDCALAMGWLNVIINEELYDKEFVSKWCIGFEKVRERVQEYPPHKVAEITWIPEDKIIESARVYATNRPSSIAWGVACDQIGLNASRCEQAKTILRAITGNIDVRGGNLLPGPGPKKDERMFIRDSQLEIAEKCSSLQRKKQIGADTFKLMTWPGWELIEKSYKEAYGISHAQGSLLCVPAPLLWRTILTGKPYPIKSLIISGSNPMVWAPNTKLIHRALKSPNLELHVSMDFWLTPTAELADYVLPAASWLERPLCFTSVDSSNFVFGGERAIPPLGERRTDYQFWRELGIRLGQKEFWPWETDEELIKYRLKPLNITFQEFVEKCCILSPKEYKKYEKTGFATPSGKVELYSTIFEKLGYDPLPFYEEPPESPARTPKIAEGYPLILNTGGKSLSMFHSEHRQREVGLRERCPEPIIEIHPETAHSLGIEDGDKVCIETRRGIIKQKAKLTSKILPKVVNAQSHWWFPEMPGEDPSLHGVWEANANILVIDEPDCCDPLVGGWSNRGLLCRVYKA